MIGVDEHVWRHSRRGDKYFIVIIDLAAVRQGTGSARLLDMVEGRSKQAFAAWLAEREESWRQAVVVVTMDGFTGFKTAVNEELPEAVAVMDSFHVVRLGGKALDTCRRRVQLDTCGHRSRKTDPLYAARRALQTVAAGAVLQSRGYSQCQRRSRACSERSFGRTSFRSSDHGTGGQEGEPVIILRTGRFRRSGFPFSTLTDAVITKIPVPQCGSSARTPTRIP